MPPYRGQKIASRIKEKIELELNIKLVTARTSLLCTVKTWRLHRIYQLSTYRTNPTGLC